MSYICAHFVITIKHFVAPPENYTLAKVDYTVGIIS